MGGEMYVKSRFKAVQREPFRRMRARALKGGLEDTGMKRRKWKQSFQANLKAFKRLNARLTMLY
jgi:hypothetical protein